MDIRKENKFALAIGFGQLRLEIREDVEVGGERGAVDEVIVITAGPEKRFALGAFEAAEIDGASVENGFVFGGKIFADNADEIHVRKKTGGQREISGRAADRAIHAAERSFHGIKSTEPTTSNDMCSFPRGLKS